MCKQWNELLDDGLINPSKAPYGDTVLFQKKQDRTMQMCVDYRALNKASVKNKYPVPLVWDLMDRLVKHAGSQNMILGKATDRLG